MVYRLKCISMEDELIGPKIWGAKENTRAYGKSKVLADEWATILAQGFRAALNQLGKRGGGMSMPHGAM